MIASLPRISIQDVARRARVSATTVSMVINSKGNISAGTRQRVMALCQKLNYQPHPTARLLPKLRSRNPIAIRSGLFGFTPVYGGPEEGTYHEFLQGVAEIGINARKRIIYEPVRAGDEIYAAFLEHIPVDGRILIGAITEQVLAQFKTEGTPLVIAGDHSCASPVWNVHIDTYAAGRLAAEHFWELGHRRMALFCEAKISGYQTQFRNGFVDALRQRGIRARDCRVLDPLAKESVTIEGVLSSTGRPTAVAAIQGGKVLQVLETTARLGLKIPQDLSLLMFGRPGLSQHDLAYIDPAHEEIGRRAMELVIRLTEKESGPPNQILIPPVLKKGETCAHCAGGSTFGVINPI